MLVFAAQVIAVLFALLQVTRKCLIQIPVMIPLNQIFNILP